MSLDQLIAVLWSLTTALAIVTGCYLVERLSPFERDPGVSARIESLVLFLLNAVLLAGLSPIISDLVVRLPSLNLLAHVSAIDWLPAVAKTAALIFIYALVWDFFQYWVHRAEHEYGFLWRLHRTHHDDLNMTSATAIRQSVGGSLIGVIGVHLPAVCILGYSGLPYIGGLILFSAWGYYNHANVNMPLPALEGFVSGPNVHRLHHSHAVHLRGCNLAAFFTFYDRLFGTFVAPPRHERLSTRSPRPEPFGLRRVVWSWLSLGRDSD
ncbi:MAG TPA: sterol desaturase family protein [Vicinamibacterales bacterium]|nr:sterol desaturase family protein [Vicinamibacterales bacterium]